MSCHWVVIFKLLLCLMTWLDSLFSLAHCYSIYHWSNYPVICLHCAWARDQTRPINTVQRHIWPHLRATTLSSSSVWCNYMPFKIEPTGIVEVWDHTVSLRNANIHLNHLLNNTFVSKCEGCSPWTRATPFLRGAESDTTIMKAGSATYMGSDSLERLARQDCTEHVQAEMMVDKRRQQ